MLHLIAQMYVTLGPVILSGIFNMIFCKLKILKTMQVPMDGGRVLRDGNRIFGDNKTWKGFLGYLIFGTVFTVIWGFAIRNTALNSLDFFYINNENTLTFNMIVGVLLGLAYALFELPNSFVKRRLSITPGKPATGIKKAIFVFVDQADSIFGCALVVWFFYDLGILKYIGFVVVGAVTHIIFNMLLYFAHLRKNMF
ncbi:CDP-archaeol synthase [Butyrivibrio sp. XPD2006]|uniref:CDP-archaeol synthase n=1 Tax=Butyrivibrio sp. XPD2006 TaxID=1280668 RepID=UPI0003B6DA91|nr:CDP-archaeol synthase [Butyrivibrio sp. XPD2006]